jgi:hypothetical protein
MERRPKVLMVHFEALIVIDLAGKGINVLVLGPAIKPVSAGESGVTFQSVRLHVVVSSDIFVLLLVQSHMLQEVIDVAANWVNLWVQLLKDISIAT